MPTTLSTIARPAGTQIHATCFWIFDACWQRAARHFARRTALASLRELDDDALEDIGLAYSEIEAAVYGRMIAPSPARI